MKFSDSFDGTFTENIRHASYKQPNQFKKNKITINLSGILHHYSETQYAVVKHISKKKKWNLIADPLSYLNFDVCWIDGHLRQDIFARMGPHQKINHFPGTIDLRKGMTILSRKNNLGHNLMAFRKKFPSEYDFFPVTWNLPQEYAELEAYHQCRQQGKAQTFIVKPQASCQGRGIFLTRNIERLKYEKCVAQRYMHKPYLIEGTKFDLRIYVLLAGIDPFRIFVFNEGLARFATEPYRAPRSQNLDNKYMHLTNYAINKEHPNFIFNETVEEMNKGHKRSLSSVYQLIQKQGHDVQVLKAKINDILIKTIVTGYPTLSSSFMSVHPDNFANDMCFEILGFDIMLDYKLNPYLIEINYTPSFTADTPLDRYIKKALIQDSLVLINLSEKWKKQMKIKRDRQIQDRMVSGKRKKYSVQQRRYMMIEEARRRDEYEINNMGRFTKIFMTSHSQLKQYEKYYDYAMQLFESGNKYDNNYSNSHLHAYYQFYYQNIPSISKKQKKDIKNVSQIMKDNKATKDKDRQKDKQKDKEKYKDKEKQKDKIKDKQYNVVYNISEYNAPQNSVTQQIHKNTQNAINGAFKANPNASKRSASAKTRKQRRQNKQQIEKAESKRSLKYELDYDEQNQSGNNFECGQKVIFGNSSIFHNKILEDIMAKQRRIQQADTQG